MYTSRSLIVFLFFFEGLVPFFPVRPWAWCALVVWSLELQALTWILVSITSLSFVVNCHVLCSRDWNKLISITLDSSLQDSSNYSSDKHAVRAKRAAKKSTHGDQSFLPCCHCQNNQAPWNPNLTWRTVPHPAARESLQLSRLITCLVTMAVICHSPKSLVPFLMKPWKRYVSSLMRSRRRLTNLGNDSAGLPKIF